MLENYLIIQEAIIGFLSNIYGGFDYPLKVLVLFMTVDFATGLLVGLFKKSPNTEDGTLKIYVTMLGLAKKFEILVIILVAYQLGVVLTQPFIKDVVIMAYVISESLSILRNAGLMGIYVPQILKSTIDVLKRKEEGEEKK